MSDAVNPRSKWNRVQVGDFVEWSETWLDGGLRRSSRMFGLVLEVWDSNVYEPSESIVLVSGTMDKARVRTRDLRVSISRDDQ